MLAALPLLEAHVAAKNPIYNLEALDSAMRSLSKVIECHKNL
jgi:hypothetical protein